MWLVESYYRQISVKDLPNIFSYIAIKANFPFSHCKSMTNLSCHSNQTAGAIAIKNSSFIGARTKTLSVHLKRYRPQNYYGDAFFYIFIYVYYFVAMATSQNVQFK